MLIRKHKVEDMLNHNIITVAKNNNYGKVLAKSKHFTAYLQQYDDPSVEDSSLVSVTDHIIIVSNHSIPTKSAEGDGLVCNVFTDYTINGLNSLHAVFLPELSEIIVEAIKERECMWKIYRGESRS